MSALRRGMKRKASEPAEAKQVKRVQQNSQKESNITEASDNFEFEYRVLEVGGSIQRPATRQRGIDHADGYELYQKYNRPKYAGPSQQQASVAAPLGSGYTRLSQHRASRSNENELPPEIDLTLLAEADRIVTASQRRAVAQSQQKMGSIAPVHARAPVAAPVPPPVPVPAPILPTLTSVAHRGQAASTRGGLHKEQASKDEPERNGTLKEAARRSAIFQALHNKDATTADDNDKSPEPRPEDRTSRKPSETEKPSGPKKRFRPVIEDSEDETDEEPQKRLRTVPSGARRKQRVSTTQSKKPVGNVSNNQPEPEKHTNTVASSFAHQVNRSQPNNSGDTKASAAARKPLAPKPDAVNKGTSSQTHKRSRPDRGDISRPAKRVRTIAPEQTTRIDRNRQPNGAHNQPGQDVRMEPVKRCRNSSARTAQPAATPAATRPVRAVHPQPARTAAATSVPQARRGPPENRYQLSKNKFSK